MKGMFLTSAMILLSSIFFITYISEFSISHSYTDSQRVLSMNRFIDDIEKDMNRAFYIATFRSLVALEDEITNTGNFTNTSLLEELCINGTMNEEKYDIMENSSLSNWLERITTVANNIGMNVDVKFSNFTANQTNSWFVNFYVFTNENLSDKKGSAYWIRKRNLSTSISIEGRIDPTFPLHTDAKVMRFINKCNFDYYVRKIKSGTGSGWVYGYVNYTDSESNANSSRIVVSNDMSSWDVDVINTFLGAISTSFPDNVTIPHATVSDISNLPEKVLISDGNVYDIENLRSFLFDGCYRSSKGPSYLMRLGGNLSNSPVGIESFVNIDELSANGVSTHIGKSCVDYIYFSNEDTMNYQIKGMPDWFYIDEDHLNDYNCTEITR